MAKIQRSVIFAAVGFALSFLLGAANSVRIGVVFFRAFCSAAIFAAVDVAVRFVFVKMLSPADSSAEGDGANAEGVKIEEEGDSAMRNDDFAQGEFLSDEDDEKDIGGDFLPSDDEPALRPVVEAERISLEDSLADQSPELAAQAIRTVLRED